MKTAKIGAIFLVSVMALAGVTAGYAWWTDHLYIRGTVTTDNFGAEWDLIDFPCTYISHRIKWSDGLEHEPYHDDWALWYDEDGNPDPYDEQESKK